MSEACDSCPFFINGAFITWKPDLAGSEGECNAPEVGPAKYNCCYSTMLLFLFTKLVTPEFINSFYASATVVNPNAGPRLRTAIIDHFTMGIPSQVEAAKEFEILFPADSVRS